MEEIFVYGLVVGVLCGGFVGFRVGAWMAAVRAARATYRTQRGRK